VWVNSAETNHHPVMWDQGKAAAESTVIAVPEHKKLKDIKYLHPFENKVRSLYSTKPCSHRVYHRFITVHFNYIVYRRRNGLSS
jgi:hypothetical protein